MIRYCTAWNKDEMYQPALTKPADERLHIPDSSEIKTLCSRQVFRVHKSPGNPLLLEVCRACQNKMRCPNRKAKQ
jgi:hypothetical protein